MVRGGEALDARPPLGEITKGAVRKVFRTLEGCAGYSLPDGLLSGTGLRIAQGIAPSAPVAGTYLAFFAFGGEYPDADIVPPHILLVPGLSLGLITLHLLLVVHLEHTHWPGPAPARAAYPPWASRDPLRGTTASCDGTPARPVPGRGPTVAP